MTLTSRTRTIRTQLVDRVPAGLPVVPVDDQFTIGGQRKSGGLHGHSLHDTRSASPLRWPEYQFWISAVVLRIFFQNGSTLPDLPILTGPELPRPV